MSVKAEGSTKETLTAVALFSLAGLHVMWGLGSSFPFRNREELADSVIGTSDVPPLAACMGVAAALTLAAILVTGVAPLPKSVRRIALRIAATVLATRGLAGAFGRTSTLSPGSDSPTFQRLDRRIYAPLCLWLAAGVRRSI
jgi:hypothetical protein